MNGNYRALTHNCGLESEERIKQQQRNKVTLTQLTVPRDKHAMISMILFVSASHIKAAQCQ